MAKYSFRVMLPFMFGTATRARIAGVMRRPMGAARGAIQRWASCAHSGERLHGGQVQPLARAQPPECLHNVRRKRHTRGISRPGFDLYAFRTRRTVL